EVVKAVRQQEGELAVGLVLAGAREGGGAEERDAAGVAGAAERASLDHEPLWYADRARVPQIRHRRRSPSAMSIPRFGLNRFDPRSVDAFAADVKRAEALGWDAAFQPDSQLRRRDTYVFLAAAAPATEPIPPGPL